MLKIFLAIVVGKLVNIICRLVPKLGGTALPGLLAIKINQNILSDLLKKNCSEIIVITGTNGKTTTSRLLTHILTEAKIPYLQNRTGSNLIRGLVSSLLTQTSLTGQLKNRLIIFELDEAILPQFTKMITPKIILFTNLFRDQLDRYGEIDTILQKWRQALKPLKPTTTVIYNSDDPSLAYLTADYQPKISFGLDKSHSTTKTLSSSADAISCLNCYQPLIFSSIFTSHLGHYHCPACHFKRPKPNYTKTINSPLIGIYNHYNLLAATLLAKTLNINDLVISKAIKSFTPAFGRGEIFTQNQKTTQIFLVKNPTGYNAVLETLTKTLKFNSSGFLLALNDNLADGTDISWIWDVHFNYLKCQKYPLIISGNRALELALRLKYTGLPISKFLVETNLNKALTLLKNQPTKTSYILPTYTAMLSLREILKKKKIIHSTWKD